MVGLPPPGLVTRAAPDIYPSEKMKPTISFDQLVDSLPEAQSQCLPAPLQGVTTYLRTPTAESNRFIPPSFSSESSSPDPRAQVLLISAPAAVGKSYLARTLAYRTQSLLWDLGRFSVGAGFFSGVLVDTFGTAGMETLIAALRAGTATLVLDAADEALVRSGRTNFYAAIDNLANLIRGARVPHPSAVILGRPETVAECVARLSDNGVSTDTLRVNFYTEDQARAFIKRKARPDTSHRIATEFDTFVDAFFKTVSQVLGGSTWSDNESFLGYAPVLDAVGEFYRLAPNPMRRLSEAAAAGVDNQVWNLLTEIVKSVLEREVEKFGQAFGGDNEDKRTFGSSTYSPSQQIVLLLSDAPEEEEPDVALTNEVEDSWIETIVGDIRAQFRDHPFRRILDSEPNPLLRFSSVVFRDYAIAANMVDSDTAHAERIRDYWSDPRVSPSPMLSRFALSPGLALPEINANALSVILDSHASGFDEAVTISVDSYPPDDDSQGSKLDITLYDGDVLAGTLTSKLTTSEPLRLLRGAARTQIDCQDSIILCGSGQIDFQMGPDSVLRCREFQAEASEVHLRTREGRPNRLATEIISGSTMRVFPAEAGMLNLQIPRSVFPWHAFATGARPKDADEDIDLYWAGMEMRKNTRWFLRRSNWGDTLSYPERAMADILAKGRASRRVHDFWRSRNYVTLDAFGWELEFPGFGAGPVCANDLSNVRYREVLVDFVRWCGSYSVAD